jgi:chromosome partitioning protein
MVDDSESALFTALFDKPAPESLRTLNAGAFHRFVRFVFQRAGYDARARPLDLVSGVAIDLYTLEDGRRHVGVVGIHHAAEGEVLTGRQVKRLQRASSVRKGGNAAYIITTGSFDRSAQEQARRVYNTFLLTGEQFCRYIRYCQHSRYPKGVGLTVLIRPDEFSDQSESWQSPPGTYVLVFANNKGGVGKTTSARNVGLNFAANGSRVLLVDLDPQQNLTEGFFERIAGSEGRMTAEGASIVQYFTSERKLDDLVQPAFIERRRIDNLFLIPSHQDLSLLDTGGAGRPEVEARFARDLRALVRKSHNGNGPAFDWVIIDTPPAISLFTRIALCTADYVITPARARVSSLAGIKNMFNALDAVGQLRSRSPKVLGCLLTHWEDDQDSTQTYVKIEEQFDLRRSRIFANYIRFDPTIEKPHGPTQHHARDDYRLVSQEVLEYVDRDG